MATVRNILNRRTKRQMVPSVPGADNDNNSLEEPSDEESSFDRQQEPHASRSSEDRGPASVPLPRGHSYLLGSAQQPLQSFTARACSDGDRPSSQDQQYQRPAAPHQERIFQLPILPLFGVVLFPGSTLPVKLRDRSMIRYLVPQLIECSSRRRRHHSRRQYQDSSSPSPLSPPPEDVRLGIITLDQESSSMIRHHHQQRHRVSTTTTTATTTTIATARLVGTIATIQYTSLQQDETTHVEEQEVNDDNESSSTAPVNHHQEATSMDELVFTAVGTGRFEFIEVISEQDPMIWKVRQLVDGGPFLTYPPMLRQRLWSSGPPDTMQPYDGHGDNDNNDDEDVEEEEEEQTTTRSRRKVRTHDIVTWNLSLVTPVPHFVSQHVWPSKIVDELMTWLNDPNTARNGETNLPHLDLRGGKVVGGGLPSMSSWSPMEISYYLAGNMPFTQNR